MVAARSSKGLGRRGSAALAPFERPAVAWREWTQRRGRVRQGAAPTLARRRGRYRVISCRIAATGIAGRSPAAYFLKYAALIARYSFHSSGVSSS